MSSHRKKSKEYLRRCEWCGELFVTTAPARKKCGAVECEKKAVAESNKKYRDGNGDPVKKFKRAVAASGHSRSYRENKKKGLGFYGPGSKRELPRKPPQSEPSEAQSNFEVA